MKTGTKKSDIQKNTGRQFGDDWETSVGDGKEFEVVWLVKVTAPKIVVPRLVFERDIKTGKIGQLFENMDCPGSCVPIE